MSASAGSWVRASHAGHQTLWSTVLWYVFDFVNCIPSMYSSLRKIVLALTTPLLTPFFTPTHPVVQLSYASYRGLVDTTDGVAQWLGMRYAAPPLGDLRFAAPEDPPNIPGVHDASKHAPYCLGIGDKAPFSKAVSEDCLYLDVYAPSNATNTSSLPVFVFIQGGGFATNANANYDGKGLIVASGHKILVVTFNYRVGPYGFITGAEIESLNNGLKDQRKALQWVQKHISAFGGDPNHVVVGGDSAGAASITLLLTAYGGRNENLFHAAAAESQSFAPVLTANESQYLYNDLVTEVGCAGHSDTFACLRSLSAAQLQRNTTTIPYPGAPAKPLYSWNPAIDGDLIRDYTYRAFNTGAFIKVPTIFGDDTNAGTIFVPRSTNTLGDSNRFLRDQFTYLTLRQLSILDKLYPNPNLTFPHAGAYWRQASNVYGEMRYMCPGLFLSSIYSTHNISAWNYRYNVQDPAQMQSGLGVPHTVELNAIFGPGNVGHTSVPASYLPRGSNAEIVPVIQAYWTSFIRCFNPNTHRLAGTATWEQWNAQQMNRFLFDTPVKASAMENVDDGLRARCEYLWSIGVSLKQ